MVVSLELTRIFNYRWNVALVINIGWHCLLLVFIALLNMGLVRLSRCRSIVASISVFRRLWLIPQKHQMRLCQNTKKSSKAKMFP
jgi:hypothetical protein